MSSEADAGVGGHVSQTDSHDECGATSQEAPSHAAGARAADPNSNGGDPPIVTQVSRPLVETRGAPAGTHREILGATDEITSVALHTSYGLVGTHQGYVYRLDLSGNRVLGAAAGLGRRGVRIRALAVDASGLACASAGDDGSIVVVVGTTPIFAAAADGCAGTPWLREHGDRPVLAVALCPDFGTSAKGDGKQQVLCAGGEDGRLVLHRRTRFGGFSVVHEGEGPITCIRWRGDLVAWANERGVKVFNVRTGEKVTYVARPLLANALCRCHLVWVSEDRLLIGWGVAVKVVVIIPARSGTGSLYGEVRHNFEFEDVVCGLAAAGPSSLCILTADGGGCQVELRLCSLDGTCFHVADAPALRGAFHAQLCLEAIAPHLPFYMVAPRDFVAFQLRDLLEHAVHLLEAGCYEEAARLADGGGDGVQGLRHIVCLKCLRPDLEAGRFDRACNTLGRFRRLDPETWQESAVLFERFNGLQHLAVSEVLPVPPKKPPLPAAVYDEILHRLVSCPSALVVLFHPEHGWSVDIFSVGALEDKLRAALPEVLDTAAVEQLDELGRGRVEALALLRALDGRVAAAVELLLALGSPEVFWLLRRDLNAACTLLQIMEERVATLFEIDDRKASALFVSFHRFVSVDAVVAALQGRDNRWRHEYLKQLFAVNEVAGQSYEMEMVLLYAEYEPRGLLPFLRASERYPLDAALTVCQQRGLLEEEAYLLGRAGRVGEALDIFLRRMSDVKRAVQFATEYPDQDLWKNLVDFVLERPDLLVPLLVCLEELESVAAEVGRDTGRPQPPPAATPAHVLRQLPAGTPAPRVAASVKQTFGSFELSASVWASVRRLSLLEMLAQKRAFITARNRGLLVAPQSQQCAHCGRPLSRPPPESLVASGEPASPSAKARARATIVMRGKWAAHELCQEEAVRKASREAALAGSRGSGSTTVRGKALSSLSSLSND